jgi:hypothetical protein
MLATAIGLLSTIVALFALITLIFGSPINPGGPMLIYKPLITWVVVIETTTLLLVILGIVGIIVGAIGMSSQREK